MTRCKLLAATSIFLLACSPLHAANDQAAAALPDLFYQISKAFAAQPVSTVTLSGTAQWYAGSFQDSGSITLLVSADGSSQVQLSLGKKGAWTEAQTSVGPSMTCRWAAADGAPHKLSASNCLRPSVWFLPAVMFQATSPLNSLSVVDLGVGLMGDGTYRHAQLQFPLVSLNNGAGSGAAQASAVDIGVDPVSFLPQILAYKIPPDDGSQIQVPIEVHFSDYRPVNGTQLPFHIQRYLNGTLQLDITINTAQVN